MGQVVIVSRGSDSDDAAEQSLVLRRLARTAGLDVSDLSPRTWTGRSQSNTLSIVQAGPWHLIGRVLNRERRVPAPSADEDPLGYERKLISRFWGRFLGVRLQADGQVGAMLRDPSGGLDCIAWAQGDLTVITSFCPAWLFDGQNHSGWRISFDRVAQALHNPLHVWEDLLIDGPMAILPGTVQPVPLNLPATPIWKPADIARRASSHPLSNECAMSALTLSVDDAVRGLANSTGPLAAEVSGGLDSSIVASSLVRVRKDVGPWLNLHGADARSDERAFVAALAERLSIHVESVPHASGPFSRSLLDSICQGFRPGLNSLDVHHDRDWARRLAAQGATAVMTGRGGDSVLLQAMTGDIYTDLWRAKGWRALLSKHLPQLAAANEKSIWSLIAEARKTSSGSMSSSRDTALLRPISDGERTVPHWLRDCEDLGPAKRLQIAGLIDGIGRQAPSAQSDDIDVLTPILSLPVVETCLSLPTWQLTLGGRDRGLARAAFRDRLPALISERRTKGEMSMIYGRMIADNLHVLRPWLLDGRLAAEGLIDRVSAGKLLTPDSLAWRGAYGEIMIAAAFEGWVRVWEGRLESTR